MEELIEQTKGVPLAKGFNEVFYPGEIEARNEAQNRQLGIALPDDTIDDLRTIARAHGLQSDLPF